MELTSRQQFDAEGYVCLPERLDPETAAAVCRRLDHLAATNPGRKALLPDPFFNDFVVHPIFMRAARAFLGDKFMFHHACGRALTRASVGKEWHHDYDGTEPWQPDAPMMIHIMVYPAGLTASTGPLLIVPGSHLQRVSRETPRRFGLDAIEGAIELCVEPGSVIVINSALWHARKLPRQLPRYDLNISFCQPGVERPERKAWLEAYLSVAVQTLRETTPESPWCQPGLIAD